MDSTFVNLVKDLAMFAKDTLSNIAPEVWEMARMKVMAGIYVNAFFAISSLIVFAILPKYIKILHKTAKEAGYDNEGWIILLVVAYCLVMACFIAFFACGAALIYNTITIDYHTLESIMNLIH